MEGGTPSVHSVRKGVNNRRAVVVTLIIVKARSCHFDRSGQPKPRRVFTARRQTPGVSSPLTVKAQPSHLHRPSKPSLSHRHRPSIPTCHHRSRQGPASVIAIGRQSRPVITARRQGPASVIAIGRQSRPVITAAVKAQPQSSP